MSSSNIAGKIYREIVEITSQLIDFNLSVDQNFPSSRQVGNEHLIDWGTNNNLSIVFKNINYHDIYDELETDRNYSIKMIDGALVQIMYTIINNQVVSHRLAFFPNPYLEKYQNDPELYLKQDLYADILAKNIVPVPIRFDYNEKVHDEIHAKSHVTFGQYKNCRVPVSAPLTPSTFIDFLLRNFYSNAYNTFSISLNSAIELDRSITDSEEKVLHFNLVT